MRLSFQSSLRGDNPSDPSLLLIITSETTTPQTRLTLRPPQSCVAHSLARHSRVLAHRVCRGAEGGVQLSLHAALKRDLVAVLLLLASAPAPAGPGAGAAVIIAGAARAAGAVVRNGPAEPALLAVEGVVEAQVVAPGRRLAGSRIVAVGRALVAEADGVVVGDGGGEEVTVGVVPGEKGARVGEAAEGGEEVGGGGGRGGGGGGGGRGGGGLGVRGGVVRRRGRVRGHGAGLMRIGVTAFRWRTASG